MSVLWPRFELDLTYFFCVYGPIMFIFILSLEMVGSNDPALITCGVFERI